MSEPSLKAKVTSGVFWSAGARVAQQGLQFGLSVVLARLLSPGDYGLMAMVMVFTGFAGMLADAGFNTAVIQRKDLREEHIHTVFWITLGSGVALAAVTFVLAPWLAVFFKAPALTQIFRVSSLNFIFGGLGNVPSALLQRRMEFRAVAKVEISAMILSGVIGVAMAWQGYGVWSLVGQSLASSLLISTFRCWACRWLPRMMFSQQAFADIWKFSSHLYGFNFINYWARNADNLLVGKYFGAAPLGAYNRAYALMLLPITQISSVVSQVIFPALSSVQDDVPRVKRIYLRTIGLIALVAFPMMAGLALVADPFVRTVYGEKWLAVIPLLQIMSFLGATQSLVSSTGWIYFSLGQTRLMFYWGTFSAVVTILSFVVGVFMGSVVNLAWCYAVANVVLFWPGIHMAGRIISMSFAEVMEAISGPFFATCGMAVAVFGVRFLLPATLLPWVTLLIQTATGVVVYAVLAMAFKLKAWREGTTLLAERLGGRFGKPAANICQA